MRAESASLAPVENMAQFVIGRLLDGIKVTVRVDGKECVGTVYNLDFAPGSPHVFAKVHVLTPGNEDGLEVRVAIERDGNVLVLPNQEQ